MKKRDGYYWVVLATDENKEKENWEIKQLSGGVWVGFGYCESDYYDVYQIMNENTIEP